VRAVWFARRSFVQQSCPSALTPISDNNCNSDAHSNCEADTDAENCSNAKIAAYSSAASVAAVKETVSSDS